MRRTFLKFARVKSSSISDVVGTIAGSQQPFQAAVLQSTSIHTNLAVEDEFHRRLEFASVVDLTKRFEMQSGDAEASTRSSSEPFAMSAGPGSSHRCLSLLLSYINEPCVVIGRNQNPWQETNFKGIGDTHSPSNSAEASPHPVELARRSSGGGAVYHDLGNVCFSFLTHRTLYDPARSVEILRQYLLCRLAPYVVDADITTTKRNDLFLFGHKITGSAMKVTSRGCFHHLTLLVASERSDLGTYLRRASQWEWVTSLAVDSVRSPVTTLATALQSPKSTAGKHPSLVPMSRFEASGPAAASPYERLLRLAQNSSPFDSSKLMDETGASNTNENSNPHSLSKHEQAKLIQQDFCRYYQSSGGGTVVPDTYLSQDIVPRKSTEVDVAVAAASAANPVPFVSSEYGKKKALLLKHFSEVYPPVSSFSNSLNDSQLLSVMISDEDLNSAELAANDDKRGDDRKLTDPKTIIEALNQQWSRVWLLRNTPKFTTMVVVKPTGLWGWAQFGRGFDMLPSTTSAPRLPNILIRTQMDNGGVIDSVTCRFATDSDVLGPEAGSSKTDITEEESKGLWFSEVIGVMLSGLHLRDVSSKTIANPASPGPFPPAIGLVASLRACEGTSSDDKNQRQLLMTAIGRSLADSPLAWSYATERIGGLSPTDMVALGQSIVTGDVDEVISTLSHLGIKDTHVEAHAATLFADFATQLMAAWQHLNAW